MIHFGKELPALLRTQKQRESIQNKILFPKSKRDHRPTSKSFGSERKRFWKIARKTNCFKEELTKSHPLEEAFYPARRMISSFRARIQGRTLSALPDSGPERSTEERAPLYKKLKAKNQDSMSVYFTGAMQNYPSKMPRKDSRRVRFKRLMTTTSGRFTGNSMFLAKTPAPARSLCSVLSRFGRSKVGYFIAETSRHNGTVFPA